MPYADGAAGPRLEPDRCRRAAAQRPCGAAVPRNIIPAALAGWTDAQVVRAVTQGVSADGRRLGPPMGFGYYARMSQGALRDLVACLRSLPAQR